MSAEGEGGPPTAPAPAAMPHAPAPGPAATPGSDPKTATSGVGLTAAEAGERLAKVGPNEIRREAATPPWRILLRQFMSPVIALLIVSSVLALGLGEVADGLAILTIVVLNGLIGFFQEYRAEKAVLALRAMTAPRARVLRDGHATEITAGEVVPGDVLLLEAGDLVAADAQLVEVHGLTVNESALTGESVPVEKDPAPLGDEVSLADRHDRVYAGTAVVAGTGSAEVFATAMETQLGHIAHLLATTEDEATPLQVQLEGVSRTLIKVCLAIVVAVGILGFMQGLGWLDVLLSSVSLAVAAVPEGLPAIVTIALAVGVQRMAARHVLVRRLPSVETLGAATVICTDKTGTLTTGQMVVREVWGADKRAVAFAAAANCDADLATKTGDPTELALLEDAHSQGIERADIERDLPRGKVNPFDADRKRMSIRRSDGVLYVKGAPDLMIPLCTAGIEGAVEANRDLAARGLRVLGVATGKGETEEGLTLLGLVGIADPPRKEAIEAVAHARAAGIATIMITGDHPVTAEAIAREMGILQEGEPVESRVHARATPEDKLRIVKALKEKGDIVAMTGDGVNDAPALREAHIGIAMGIGGTEVTREAADMVLADDNFASIVAAVSEGRGIYDNIQKTVVYLMAGNFGELLVMLGAAIGGLPLPLLPIQLLWINLATDGLPALALVMDPVDADILARPPRPQGQPMLGRPEWITILSTGLLQGAVTLGVFAWTLRAEGIEQARNMAFTTLVFGELFRAFAARSRTRTFWQVGALSNLRLLAIVLGSAAIQVGMHHVGFAQTFFDLAPISLGDCLQSIGLGLIPVSVMEISKLVVARIPSVAALNAKLLGLKGGQPARAARGAENAKSAPKAGGKEQPESKDALMPHAKPAPASPAHGERAAQAGAEIAAAAPKPPPAPTDPAVTPNAELPTAKAESRAEAKPPAGPPNVTPHAVERIHELYEELGRDQVRALQDWESRKQNPKAEPVVAPKPEQAEPKPIEGAKAPHNDTPDKPTEAAPDGAAADKAPKP